MRIGLVSDTHNDQSSVRRALARLRTEGITRVFHAGDVTSAVTLRLFDGFDVWIAQGNMDHDPGLTNTALELFGPGRFRRVHTLALEGTSIAIIHDVDAVQARQLVLTRATQIMVVGHTHRRRDEQVESTRIINPGALGNTRWDPPCFAILDLIHGDLSWVEL
jgi:hypothetical protein